MEEKGTYGKKEIELKPCPFCGGKAVIKYGSEGYCSWIFCEDCYATSAACFPPESVEKAIEAWNRRVE